MSLLTLILYAGSLLVLFLTPGPGNIAMVARTLSGGPVQGATYGVGIMTGDIIWLTVAITGLSAASDLASGYSGVVLAVKLVGAGVLVWLAWGSLQGFLNPKPAGDAQATPITRSGLAATYAAGIAMPLSNPKAIAFYLSFLPAFFDLSVVGPTEYVAMVAILLAMGVVFIGVYVGLAHHARDWLAAKGVKRWADLVTALILGGVAIMLLVR